MNDDINQRINAIDWRSLKTAHGDARHVPQALADITSSDPEICRNGEWGLDNVVVLQSDLYESAYMVVPFLIEYLRDRVSYGRENIYDVVYEIGNGYAPHDVKCVTTDGEVTAAGRWANRWMSAH